MVEAVFALRFTPQAAVTKLTEPAYLRKIIGKRNIDYDVRIVILLRIPIANFKYLCRKFFDNNAYINALYIKPMHYVTH